MKVMPLIWFYRERKRCKVEILTTCITWGMMWRCMVSPCRWDLFSRITSFSRCSSTMLTAALFWAFPNVLCLFSLTKCRSWPSLGEGQTWFSDLAYLLETLVLCFMFIYRHHFSSSITIRYKKLCLRLRVARWQARRWKAIWMWFSLLFSLSSSSTQAPNFSKNPIEWRRNFMTAIHFFGQFTTCLVIVLLQKCFEMLFVQFRRSSASGRVTDGKIAIF